MWQRKVGESSTGETPVLLLEWHNGNPPRVVAYDEGPWLSRLVDLTRKATH